MDISQIIDVKLFTLSCMVFESIDFILITKKHLNMKRLNLLITTLLISFLSVNAQDLTMDEVLANYYEVMGFDKLKDINTVVMTGQSINQGMETPFSITTVRPDKFRLEVEIQGQKMIQVYNSGSGWFVAPWTGSLDPQDLPAEQLKSMKRQADIDGPLYNYKEKGHTAEFLGIDDMEGSEVYKIKLTFDDGDAATYLIDAENFVVLKEESIINMRGQEIKNETYFSDFKPINDMIMPFSMEMKMNGQTGQTISIETVEFDMEVDMNIFEKPAPAPVETEEPEQK